MTTPPNAATRPANAVLEQLSSSASLRAASLVTLGCPRACHDLGGSGLGTEPPAVARALTDAAEPLGICAAA